MLDSHANICGAVLKGPRVGELGLRLGELRRRGCGQRELGLVVERKQNKDVHFLAAVWRNVYL